MTGNDYTAAIEPVIEAVAERIYYAIFDPNRDTLQLQWDEAVRIAEVVMGVFEHVGWITETRHQPLLWAKGIPMDKVGRPTFAVSTGS